MNFMNNVKDQPKVTNKKSKPTTKKMSNIQPQGEKSSSDNGDIVGDVDAADLENIDSLLEKLSISEDKAKHPGNKQKFQVPMEILEIIKKR